MPIADIDAKRPTAITILGKQLVVWKDSAGDCHVFEDRCPHRLVALSEGRIEGDELMCAYHGWRFDGAHTRTLFEVALATLLCRGSCAGQTLSSLPHPKTTRICISCRRRHVHKDSAALHTRRCRQGQDLENAGSLCASLSDSRQRRPSLGVDVGLEARVPRGIAVRCKAPLPTTPPANMAHPLPASRHCCPASPALCSRRVFRGSLADVTCSDCLALSLDTANALQCVRP